MVKDDLKPSCMLGMLALTKSMKMPVELVLTPVALCWVMCRMVSHILSGRWDSCDGGVLGGAVLLMLFWFV